MECPVCNGTGKLCNTCWESEIDCGCEEKDLQTCGECEGTGKVAYDKED